MLTFIKDIGHRYATENAKQRRHFSMYLCSGCNKKYEFRTSQIKLGYTNWCKSCGSKQIHKEKT